MNQSINTDSKNSKEPQQKYRLGTVSIKMLGGLNRFYRRLTSPSASIMAQNIQLFGPRGGFLSLPRNSVVRLTTGYMWPNVSLVWRTLTAYHPLAVLCPRFCFVLFLLRVSVPFYRVVRICRQAAAKLRMQGYHTLFYTPPHKVARYNVIPSEPFECPSGRQRFVSGL